LRSLRGIAVFRSPVPALFAMLVAVSVGMPWGGASAAAASNGPETFVNIAHVPNAGSYFFTPSNSTVSVESDQASSGVITVDATSDSVSASLRFSSSGGQPLAPGDYEAGGEQASAGAAPGQAGIEIVVGDQQVCDGSAGHFRVHQITSDPDGTITSLWISFEENCGGPPTIGEVEYNVPGDGGAVVVGPHDIWWPNSETDSAPVAMPVWVWNPSSSPVTMGASSISGADSEDDYVSYDSCSGQTVAPGGGCRVVVSYEPVAAGVNHATLTVPEAGGATHTVSLEGFVSAGRTVFSLDDPSGAFGPAGSSVYFPLNAAFSVTGDYSSADLHWYGTDGTDFEAKFMVGGGDEFTPGVTYQATRPGGGGPNGIDVSGNGRGCNTETGDFTITDVYVDPWDDIERFGVQFDLTCDNATAHGTLDYQVNDIAVTTAGSLVHVSGDVSPNEPGKTVQVSIERKQSSRYTMVAKKSLRLSRASSYKTTFHRAKGKVCRVVATFAARDKRLASRTVQKFRC